MNVGTNGIVVDQHGNVLLIKRNDTRAFAPPGGALDPGERLPDAAAREVREETGLIVLPVRLAAVTYLPLMPNGFLGFSFRCLLRGGDITTSEESPVVGFFKTTPLPRRMSSFHRERVEKVLSYAGERPLFFQHSVSTFNKAARLVLRHVVYRWLDLKRRLQGQPAFVPPPTWTISTYLLCRNEAGAYLWYRSKESEPWQLPGGEATGLVSPWETAVQLAQKQTGQVINPRQLCAVFSGPQETQLALVFMAETAVSKTTAPHLRWFQPGEEPANSHAHHRQMAANSPYADRPTQFLALQGEAV